MKSNKIRKKEIKQARLKRMQKRQPNYTPTLPKNCVMADHTHLAHNNSYTVFPAYYVDKPFICKDCGVHEVWTAQQQKWWYEVAKGDINSTAVRCRTCRKQEQTRKSLVRRLHLEGLKRKACHQLKFANAIY